MASSLSIKAPAAPGRAPTSKSATQRALSCRVMAISASSRSSPSCSGYQVINGISSSDKNGKATWHTNTAAPSGDNKTYLAVQDDGELVMLKNGGSTTIWTSSKGKN